MTLEQEKRFLLLLSSYDLKSRKKIITKENVLDNIVDHSWIYLTNFDTALKSNRNEEVWRNDLAFIRKHLAMSGCFVSGIRNDWSITENGIYELHTLFAVIKGVNHLQKVTSKAICDAYIILENVHH